MARSRTAKVVDRAALGKFSRGWLTEDTGAARVTNLCDGRVFSMLVDCMTWDELQKSGRARAPRENGHLHLDATMGCAGDMLVAALLDLGLGLSVVRTALVELGVVDVGPLVRERSHGHARGLHVSFVDASGTPVDAPETNPQVARHQSPATRARPRAPKARPHARKDGALRVARALDLDDEGDLKGDVGHASDMDEKRGVHRGPRARIADWASGRPVTGHEVFALVDGGRLAPAVRARVVRTLRHLFAARGHALGKDAAAATVDGRAAIDLVCDVTSVAALVDALAPSRITCSAVAVSTTPVSHGGLREASPSTWVLAALRGVRVVERDLPFECTTPTGAALLATLAARGERLPPVAFTHVGVGLGTRELPGHVNATRALYAEPRAEGEDSERALVGALFDARIDRAHMARELTARMAEAVRFARVEDGGGAPLFELSALVPKAREDEVYALLEERAARVWSTTVRGRRAAERSVVLPVHEGARRASVRVVVRAGGPPEPHDDDVRTAAVRLSLPADEVRARARAAHARLVESGPVEPESDDGDADATGGDAS